MSVRGARRSILLLVSSMSAGGRSVRLGPRIVRILRGGGWEVAVRLTTPGDDPSAIAGGVGADSIVGALGGDGYLSAVARGCHESGALFVPMPGGRGNDLCRALHVGADPLARARDLAQLGFVHASRGDEAGVGISRSCSDGLEERVRPLDGMWVRSREGVRLALGIVSIGLDARANVLANESSVTSGPLAYGYGAFAALASHEPVDVVATVDGRERNMSGWIASVSNSGCFGGGITLVDSSDMSDGIVEVCHGGPCRSCGPYRFWLGWLPDARRIILPSRLRVRGWCLSLPLRAWSPWRMGTVLRRFPSRWMWHPGWCRSSCEASVFPWLPARCVSCIRLLVNLVLGFCVGGRCSH